MWEAAAEPPPGSRTVVARQGSDCRLSGMEENLVLLEIVFSGLVGIAALGAAGVAYKVVKSLIVVNR